MYATTDAEDDLGYRILWKYYVSEMVTWYNTTGFVFGRTLHS